MRNLLISLAQLALVGTEPGLGQRRQCAVPADSAADDVAGNDAKSHSNVHHTPDHDSAVEARRCDANLSNTGPQPEPRAAAKVPDGTNADPDPWTAAARNDGADGGLLATRRRDSPQSDA